MERSFVEQTEIVYTCNCGWVDKGHADPTSRAFGTGAQSLWEQIVTQSGQSSKGEDGFKVVYRQSMSGGGVTAGVGGNFFVARNLSRRDQESVALGIFLYVSYKFEELQGSFPFGLIPRSAASSFSIEDMTSNLLGFFQVVRGVTWQGPCNVVSRQASLKVFDTYKSQINSTKSASPSPVFFPCTECKSAPTFPNVFRSINVLSPRMKGHYVGRVFQYGSKSRNWLPIDDGLELR